MWWSSAEQRSFDKEGLPQPTEWGKGEQERWVRAQRAQRGEGGSSKSQQQIMHRDYKESKRIDLICVFTTQHLSRALSAPGCNRCAQQEAEEVWDGDGCGWDLCPHHGELMCELGRDSKKKHEQWETRDTSSPQHRAAFGSLQLCPSQRQRAASAAHRSRVLNSACILV